MNRKIKIALAGNPNCGKTTLFNVLTGSNQFVGNWPGVTVEKKEGIYKNNKNVIITDLPGVYSLSPYTIEEGITRNYLINNTPDVIVNIIDGTNLERNLYLTTQLAELGIPMIIAVNMIDEVHKNGDKINLTVLSDELNVPVCEISALKKTGIDGAIQKAIATAIEKAIPKPQKIASDVQKRYEYTEHLLKSCYKKGFKNSYSISRKTDKILLNRYLAFPLFAVAMFMLFYVSVSLVGTHTGIWVNNALFGIFNLLGQAFELIDTPLWLERLILDGIFDGVGAVLGFVPQVFILFLMLSFLEACGYMSRIAFILDRIFRTFGMSGKSFIPLLIGTGCSVPGISSSRTIEDSQNRKITIITTSFLPCSAKLPVIAFVAAWFFDNAKWVAPSAYFLGIISVIISGILLTNSKIIPKSASPFVIELPPYRLPSLKSLLRSGTRRTTAFIKRAGTVIVAASVFIWLLSHLGISGRGIVLDEAMHLGSSFLGIVAKYISIIFKPLGFGNEAATIATVMGLAAKEEIVAVLNILEFNNMTPLSAYSFLAFNLLCAPCFGAVAAIKKEMCSIKWTLFAIAYQCIFAYAVSLCIYQYSLAMSGNINIYGFICALLITVLFLRLVLNKTYRVNLVYLKNKEPLITYSAKNNTPDCTICKKCKKII